MFAKVGYQSSWMNDEEADEEKDDQLSTCPSADPDSESELRELEELLYSQVHHISNVSFTDMNCDKEDDLVVTEIDSKSIKSCYEITERSTANVQIVEFSSVSPEERNNRKQTFSVSKETFEGLIPSSKEIGRKRKLLEVDELVYTALDSEGEILISTKNSSSCVQATTSESTALDNTSHKSVQSDRDHDSLKLSSSIPKSSTAKKGKKPIAIDSSSSDSSYDAFCYDNSSLDSYVAGGDTKINFVEDIAATSAATALKKVLKTLPDCNWDVADNSRAANLMNTKGGTRYYLTKLRCHNCNTFGHLASECTIAQKLHACLLCGQRGHIARSCAKALCFVCHLSGHAVRDCPNRKRRYERCLRCGVRGHLKTICPDKWRQYHLTTSGGQLVVGDNKLNENKFCYNCSGKGHFGHECHEERIDNYTVASLPFVAKYDGVTNERSAEEDKQQKSRQQDASRSQRDMNCSNREDSKRSSSQNYESYKSTKSKNDQHSLRRNLSGQNMQSQTEYDFPRNSKKTSFGERPEKSRNVKDRLFGSVNIDARETLNRKFDRPSQSRQSSPLSENQQRRLESKQRRLRKERQIAASLQDNDNTIGDTSMVMRDKLLKLLKRNEKGSLQQKSKLNCETELNSCLNTEGNPKLAKRQAKRKLMKKRKKEKVKLAKLDGIESKVNSNASSRMKSGAKQQSSAVITTKRGFKLSVPQ